MTISQRLENKAIFLSITLIFSHIIIIFAPVMRYRNIFTLLFMLLPMLHLNAQRSRTVSVGDTHSFVEKYMESLRSLYRIIYSDSIEKPSTIRSKDIDYAPLFLPLTYYRKIAGDCLRLDLDSSATPEVQKSLLHVYLERPDLVQNTDRELDIIGAVGESEATKIQNHPDLVNKVAPKVVEPDVKQFGVKVFKPNFWSYHSDYFLQFLQNFVTSNWYKGGESNYSMVGAVTLQANYNNKQKVKWDNKLELKLGFQTSRSDSLHNLKTSEDLIRYTGKLGLQASRRWYYTIQLLTYTQFMRGFKNNDRRTYSDFLSPLNINLSVGMDYNVLWFNKKLAGTIHLAPLAYNFKYIGRKSLAARYGIDEGKHALHDFGSEFTVDLTWKFSDMMNWKTRLFGYTTYRRAELEWENTLTFQFNKYISTKVFVYPRFDDGALRDGKYGYWQYKEYASLGFSYSF